MKKYFNQYSIDIEPELIALFERYSDMLLEWNQKFNLTAIEDLDRVAIWHFIDSVMVGDRLPELSGRVIDMGSGTGFPGMILAMLFPEVEFYLVDAILKKTDFLKAVKKELGIENVTILHHHLTKGNALNMRFDHVISRAFMKPKPLFKFVKNYLNEEGVLVMLLTEKQLEAFPKKSQGEIRRYPFEGRERFLLLFERELL